MSAAAATRGSVLFSAARHLARSDTVSDFREVGRFLQQLPPQPPLLPLSMEMDRRPLQIETRLQIVPIPDAPGGSSPALVMSGSVLLGGLGGGVDGCLFTAASRRARWAGEPAVEELEGLEGLEGLVSRSPPPEVPSSPVLTRVTRLLLLRPVPTVSFRPSRPCGHPRAVNCQSHRNQIAKQSTVSHSKGYRSQSQSGSQ